MAINRQGLRFVGLLALVTVSLLVLHFSDFGQKIRPEEIRKTIQSAGPIAPLFFLLLYSLGPTFFFPSWVLSVSAGISFGPLWGTILTLIGATTGATIAFSVARYLGRGAVARILKGRLKDLDNRVENHGFQVIFILRLIPLVPFDVLDYMGGLSKIRTSDYILGTFFGIIPGTIAYVYLGHSMLDITSWTFAAAAGALVLLALMPFAYRRWKRNRSAPS
jgi:uncharacterized membrane protein YdjX (TVP38/TMEM64 family)